MSTVIHRKFVSSLTFIALTMLLILPQYIKAVIKCDLKLMNEFGLSGMKYSIHDPMNVCGQVVDKCCTVSDEIRIYQYWNTYTKPNLHRHVADYTRYTTGIIRMFWRLMELNPQLIVLKHVVKKEVLYEYDVCSSEQAVEDNEEAMKFIDYRDFLYEQEYSEMFFTNKSNHGKSFNTTMYSHDNWGNRHWEVKPGKVHEYHLKRKQNYTNVSVEEPLITFNKISCKKESQNYEKEFIIVNEKKTDYCLDLYKQFLSLDNRYFKKFLVPIKNYLTRVVDIKGSVYCAICDAHSQRYFDTKTKQLVYSNEFCKTTLQSKADLFHFMHVVFVEYMDALLQYIACFETDAKIYAFPFPNMLTKYKRRISLIKACFDSLDTDNYMDKCWFICNKYSAFGLSWFFDSDVKLVRRVYITIYSFLRKLNISEELHERQQELEKKGYEERPELLTQDNVNGLLIEPLNPSHSITQKYYLDNDTRKQILGKLNTLKRPFKDKRKVDAVNQLLVNLGMPTLEQIDRLKIGCDKLLKEKDRIEDERTTLMNAKSLKELNAVKKQLMKLEEEREKREMLKKGIKPPPNPDAEVRTKYDIGKPLKAYKPGHSMINGLIDHLYKIKEKSKVHKGYQVRRYLADDNKLYNHVAEALTNFGIPDDIVANEIQKARINARNLRSKNSVSPRSLQMHNNYQQNNANNNPQGQYPYPNNQGYPQGNPYNNPQGPYPNNQGYSQNNFNGQQMNQYQQSQNPNYNSGSGNNYPSNSSTHNGQMYQQGNMNHQNQAYQQQPQGLEGFSHLLQPDQQAEKEKQRQIKEAEEEAKERTRIIKPREVNPKMPDIEQPTQFFEKNQASYGVIQFGVRFEPEGLNLIKDFTLINYRFNVTSLLEQKFKPEEKLTTDVIFSYLESTPKAINMFNLDIKTPILSFNEVNDPKHTMYKKILKNVQQKGDFKLVAKYKKKIKRIESKAGIELKYKTDELIKRREKKKTQMLKGVAKHHKKVVAHHHVDKRHYHRNFGSIADFFVHLFGS